MSPESAIEPTASFNLRRRFALNSLTQRRLQREGEVSMDFIQNLLLTDGSSRCLLDTGNEELKAFFSWLHGPFGVDA